MCKCAAHKNILTLQNSTLNNHTKIHPHTSAYKSTRMHLPSHIPTHKYINTLTYTFRQEHINAHTMPTHQHAGTSMELIHTMGGGAA